MKPLPAAQEFSPDDAIILGGTDGGKLKSHTGETISWRSRGEQQRHPFLLPTDLKVALLGATTMLKLSSTPRALRGSQDEQKSR